MTIERQTASQHPYPEASLALTHALSETPCWTSWNTAQRLENIDGAIDSMPPSLVSALHRDDELPAMHETAAAKWPSENLQAKTGVNTVNSALYATLPTSPLNRIKCWLSNMLAARATLRELAGAGDAEISRMARDFNMSSAELRTLAGKGPQAAALLDKRLMQLGIQPLDSMDFDPAVARDLQRICSMCEARRQCIHELAAHDTSDAWKDYCPNSQTLDAMRPHSVAAE